MDAYIHRCIIMQTIPFGCSIFTSGTLFAILFLVEVLMDVPAPKARPPPPRPKASEAPPRPKTTAVAVHAHPKNREDKSASKPELLEKVVIGASASSSTGFGDWEEVVKIPDDISQSMHDNSASQSEWHPLTSEYMLVDGSDMREDSVKKRIFTTVKGEEDNPIFKGRKKPSIRKRSDD